MSVGLFFLLVGAIGVVRFPDVFSRSHAVGLTDSVGGLFTLVRPGALSGVQRESGSGADRACLDLRAQSRDDARHAPGRAAIRPQAVDQGRRFVTYSFELVLVVLVLVTAATAILVKDLISAVFILGAYSFFLALVWAWLGAVDLAFVEAVVGAGLSTVFLLLTLSQVRLEDTAIRR